MSNIELLTIDNLDYNQIMVDLLTSNNYDSVSQSQISYKTIFLIALTTGVHLKDLINLKWNAILDYDDIGGAKCLDRFELKRGYDFTISYKIQEQLLKFYSYLNQPSFDESIAIHFKDYKTIENWHSNVNLAIDINKIRNLSVNGWANYKNKNLTQFIFGRRVLETCGYSNKIANFLKGLFEIKTSQQLFVFLGYKNKTDFKYKLSDISLIEGIRNRTILSDFGQSGNRFEYGKPKRLLIDNKHFFKLKKGSDEYYPFQHFQIFHDFLNNLKLFQFDLKVRGVLVLLMISLTTGIRPSSLLKLIWSDLFFFTTNEYDVEFCILRKSIKLGRHQISLDHNTKIKILTHYRLLFDGPDKEVEVVKSNYQISFINKAPSLNDSCFVTNKTNRLTQPSLNREIKFALRKAGFQHVDKLKTESTMIMYGRRILELKGNHPPTIRALVKHFKKRSKLELFKFLEIDYDKVNERPNLKEFSNVFEHILYDI